MNWVYRIDSSSCYPRQSADNYLRARNLFEDYLKQNGYILSYNSYYKWDYIKITNIYPYTELPYNPGDEIYFIPSIELDEFRSMPVATNWTYFRFVDKTHFYKWSRLKSDSDAAPIQFKNLNVGDIFKLANRDFLYIKVFPMDTGHCKWDAVVLTGDKKGYTITLTPEANVEIVRNAVLTNHDKGDLSEAYKSQCKLNFMTYGGVPMDVINYAKADCESTWRLYKEMGNIIKKVIFNDPATIVIWGDGSKTVVKAQKGEKYDKEKGLALCYMKKTLGNQGNFNNVFREWIKPEVTAVYDEKHPELGIQDLPPKDKTKYPANIYRIKTSDLKLIANYMRDQLITCGQIARSVDLSFMTVKRALEGKPITANTKFKLSNYFNFPIGFTRYAED